MRRWALVVAAAWLGVLCAPIASSGATVVGVADAARLTASTPAGGGHANSWGSRNWSGYAVTGSGFTSVTGSWKVPTVTVTKGNRYSSTWVGIDGFSNSNLIQAGTEQDSFRHHALYYAWWEILPAYETPIPASVVPVSPGDTITVSITRGTPTWTITVTDTTKSRSFTTHQVYTGPGTSAGVDP